MKIKRAIAYILGIIMLVSFTYLLSKKNAIVSMDYNVLKPTQPEIAVQQVADLRPGIYYFGYNSCAWCNEFIPVFTEVLEKRKMVAYSVDTKSDGFVGERYANIQNVYQRTTGQASLTVPFVIFINDKGEVKTHHGTLPGHDARILNLSKNQKKMLGEKIQDLICFVEE